MKTINYVLLLIGIIGFFTCYSQTNTNKPPIKIWDKTFGGNDDDFPQTPQSIIATPDGNFIVVGYSSSVAKIDRIDNNKGLWLMKINGEGKKIWDKSFDDGEIVNSSIICVNDGFIIAGAIITGYYNGRNTSDYWIAKFNNNGIKLWNKTFKGSMNSSNTPNSIITTKSGEIIIAGSSNSKITNDKTSDNFDYSDLWILKLDSNGLKIWDKTVSKKNSFDYPQMMIDSKDGGFLVLGMSITSEENIWIVKFDGLGEIIWDKIFEAKQARNEVRDIVMAHDGGFVIAGTSSANIAGDKTEISKGQNDYWIIKINSSGQKIWDKTFGGDRFDRPFSILNTSDKGYIIIGSSESSISGDKTEANKGLSDLWLIKISSNGQKIWDKSIGGNKNDSPCTVLKTSERKFIILGSSESDISGDKSEKSRGGTDYWLVKLGFQ